MALARSLVLSLVVASGCGPRPPAKAPPVSGLSLLPDVRVAEGRPPVVLVSREGDPAAAIAVAVTTTGIGWDDSATDDPEPATALAGLLEDRLRAKNIDATVTPSWDGLRASALATSEADAARIAGVLREALVAPATAADLAGARRKLAALGRRPLRDDSLRRWARCVGHPHALPARAGKEYAELDVARLERWRSGALGLGRVAIAITGPKSLTEDVASIVLDGPEWSAAAPIGPKDERVPDTIDVFELAPDGAAPAPALWMTLDVGTSSAAVAAAEALGDPNGPLAARLSELDLPFRLREVIGTAHAHGGCVGVELEASPTHGAASTGDLASRVADAVALVRLEAAVHLAELGGKRDGRTLARRSGDAREAAERASWWALVDLSKPSPSPGADSARTAKGSVVLGVPMRRGTAPRDGGDDALAVEPSRDALAAAMTKATAAWNKPVVDARTRVEAGQGEAWVLVGSPCGTEAETDADAGITALFVAAAADRAKPSPDVRVEPWVAADGVGVLVHGPPRAGESAAAHARRLADVAARSFAAEPISSTAIARARADLLRRDAQNDGAAMSLLASALAPRHPSWVVAWGTSEPLARSSDAAVRLRAQSLRAGPLRVAVLANVDEAQAEAAVRAADRWVTRRTGEARSCPAASSTEPPKPGTYAATPRPGAVPEAYLAFPFPANDATAWAAASLVAAALDGDGSLLDKALGGASPLALDASTRVLGWPRAPALVIRVVAPQTSLDAAVMQTRALVDRLHKGGLPAEDFERAAAARAKASLSTALDPRARVVATWRGEPIDAAAARRPTPEDVRAFAAKHLSEDSMIVVASRPGRPEASP
mgnify:CR=1 FL=1